MKGISARIFKSRRTPESSARCGRCIVEPLECRRLLTNTLQITIPAQVTSITAKDLQNVGIQFQLRDLPGTLTLTGENLAAQTVGKNVTVTGNVSQIDDLSVFNTTPASSLMVKGPAGAIPLMSFESTGPMKMIDITHSSSTGRSTSSQRPRCSSATAWPPRLTSRRTFHS
ncbi:MAG: hypothetical protein JWL69_3405 [Phycisphaerales bacterium]|nr:hypothetical protein [Phycisphaerales bacterium]